MSTTLNTKHPIYLAIFHKQHHHPPSTYEQHACANMECAYKSKMFMCLASLESKVIFSILCNTLTFKSNRWGRSRFNFNICSVVHRQKQKQFQLSFTFWNIMTSLLKCLIENTKSSYSTVIMSPKRKQEKTSFI